MTSNLVNLLISKNEEEIILALGIIDAQNANISEFIYDNWDNFDKNMRLSGITNFVFWRNPWAVIKEIQFNSNEQFNVNLASGNFYIKIDEKHYDDLYRRN